MSETVRKIVGVNDDESTCCCCGKSNLKRVVWISENDEEAQHYGTTCAARLMGMSGKSYSGKNGAAMLRSDVTRRDEQRAKRAATREHAQRLADTYGRPWAVVRVSRYGQYGGHTRYITTKDAAVFVDGDRFYPSNKEELRKLEVVHPQGS